MNLVLRTAVHISMVAFALTIGRWPAWAVCLGAVIALLFNLFLLPRISRRRLEKSPSGSRQPDPGLLSYPLSVLILSLVFFSEQHFMAIGWGALAFGDSAAQLAGRRYGRHPLPWNRQKSWQGMLSGWLAGTLGTWLLLQALPDPAFSTGWAHGLGMLALVMAIAAWAETLPGTLDDNLWVPLVAGFAAWLFVHAGPVRQLPWPADLPMAAAAIGVFMGLAWLSKGIDLAGTLTGGLLALLIFLGAGWTGLLCLLLLFVLGTAASKWGRNRKEALGLAQESGGKRSARHAFCNAGPAAVCGFAAFVLPGDTVLWEVALLASLASATSDTLSSEMGTLYGRRFVSLAPGQPARRGLDGVVSVEGSLAGLAAAVLLALAAGWAYGLAAAGVVVAAATLANLADSWLGATFQRWGLMTNDSVNFAANAIGAILAGSVMGFL